MSKKYYCNTDSVDIQNKQIGISTFRTKREFCIGVNHLGTKQSVKQASELARIIERLLNENEEAISILNSEDDNK